MPSQTSTGILMFMHAFLGANTCPFVLLLYLQDNINKQKISSASLAGNFFSRIWNTLDGQTAIRSNWEQIL